MKQNFFQVFPNIAYVTEDGENWDNSTSDQVSDLDSGSEDWENSLYSSEIDTSGSESDEEDDNIIRFFPSVSKYLISH